MKTLIAITILILPPGPVKSLCQDVPLPGPVSSFEAPVAQTQERESEPKWTYKKVYDKAVKNESPFVVVVGFEGCNACEYTKRHLKGLMDLGVAVYLDKDHPRAKSITWTNTYPQVVAYCEGPRGWGRYRAKPGGITQELAEGMMHRAALKAGHRPEGRFAPVPTWTEAGSRWYFAGGSATVSHLAGPNHNIDPAKLRGLSVDELDRIHSADHNGRLPHSWKVRQSTQRTYTRPARRRVVFRRAR